MTESDNPKAAAGYRKLPLELIPRIALVQEAAVLGLGADCPAKAYGRWNWRERPIDAQTYLEEMYAKHGFVRDGEEFLDDGIPHVPMLRMPVSAS